MAGKTALVTGGGSGIGFEIARQLGLHGAQIVISGRREQVLQEACRTLEQDGITAHAVKGDVRAYESCERMVAAAVAHSGHLDILVNCAAGNFLAPAEELTSNGFRTVMEIDAVGTFNMCRAAFLVLSKAGGATIVNISATLHYGATWYQTHASAAKAAVDSITRSLALEWGSAGIRVAGVAPGPIEGTTGMSKLAPGSESALKQLIQEQVPLGRMGLRRDIALAVVFLSSSAASFLTGDTLVVDGAAWMYRQPILPRQAVSQVSRGVEASSRAAGLQGRGEQRRSKL